MGMVSSVHSPERLYTDLCNGEVSRVSDRSSSNITILPLINNQAVSDSPVKVIEVILSHQPEVGPEEKQKERTAEEEEPGTLPL